MRRTHGDAAPALATCVLLLLLLMLLLLLIMLLLLLCCYCCCCYEHRADEYPSFHFSYEQKAKPNKRRCSFVLVCL